MNPKQTLEQAAEAFLATQSLTLVTNIYKGFENETPVEDDPDAEPTVKTLPWVIVEAGDAEEQVLGAGVWKASLFIRVEADAHNTTDTDFDAMCSQVFGKFQAVTSADNLSAAASSFFCYDLIPRGMSGAIKDGHNWQSTLTLDVVFAESDLS